MYFWSTKLASPKRVFCRFLYKMSLPLLIKCYFLCQEMKSYGLIRTIQSHFLSPAMKSYKILCFFRTAYLNFGVNFSLSKKANYKSELIALFWKPLHTGLARNQTFSSILTNIHFVFLWRISWNFKTFYHSKQTFNVLNLFKSCL